MRLLSNLLLILALAVAMGNSQSEEKPYQLPDSIMVTAQRFPSPVNKIIWPARTLTASQIANKPAIGDALDGVAGINLSGYGAIGHLASLMLWGSPSSQTLLLYNGRPVHNYATGGFNLAEYNIAELERIEIVKGTQSALYGSDAIGGVINLIPKIEYVDKISGAILYGNFGLFGYNLALAKEIHDWHFGANYEGNSIHNSRPNSGVRRDCLSLKSIYLPTDEDFQLAMIYRYFQDSVGLPGPVPQENSIPYYGNNMSQSLVNHQRDHNHSFDLTAKFGEIGEMAVKSLSGEISVFYDRKMLDYFGKNAYLISLDSFDITDQNKIADKNSGISAQLRHQSKNFDFSGGLEYLSGSSAFDTRSDLLISKPVEDSSVESRNYRKHHRDTYAVWSGIGFSPVQSFSVSLSGRLELVNGGSSYESFNTGFRLNPVRGLTTKFAFGMAYRLPSFNDLYWPIDDYSSGNPNLVPEKGQNAVLSVSTDSKRAISANIDLFYKRIKNLISWAPLGAPNAWGDSRWTPSNLNAFESKGLDFGVICKAFGKLRLNGDFTYQSATQKNRELVFSGADHSQVFETKKRIAAFVPKLKCRVAVSSKLYGINYSLDLVYTSKKANYYSVYNYDENYNSDISYEEKDLPASYVASLQIDKSINRIISISFSINDILDQRPIRQFGSLNDGDYPSIGRAINSKLFFNFY